MDAYCERLGPGLWGEPVNAVSNAAFLIAALLLLLRGGLRPLPVLLAVVGLCSLAFHTFATIPTAALDSLSILVYELVAIVLLVHRGFHVRLQRAWLAAPAFVLFTVAVNFALPWSLGGYLPALLVLAFFAVTLRSRPLTLATAVFTVSLTARTLDEPLCSTLPLGTHWLWHCLNAVTLYLIARAVDQAPSPAPQAPAPLPGPANP
ncbi:hypothetical protein [Paractinoplanes lichenicola]|uniref:Ceramidase n=1 Tax=Paractinoplanes lichenicola TaxID=2802976 RepID=A0ABS1VU40_9ACTN|nr:hypothetical protein [Actinoplanes lichenicola]MBL7258004.1 hypothetical protein [Actinoplanes lichenicola]